jgi:metal-responsive CopG/Arc/MetJ family transcriptional regulator
MPAKRVLISIDERILARIDDAARRTGQTRSGFLAKAAIAQIDETDGSRSPVDRSAEESRPHRQA